MKERKELFYIYFFKSIKLGQKFHVDELKFADELILCNFINFFHLTLYSAVQMKIKD